MRLSSCEGAIRSVRSVLCWKINFHGWVAGGGGWLDQMKIRLTSASQGFCLAGARAELGKKR